MSRTLPIMILVAFLSSCLGMSHLRDAPLDEGSECDVQASLASVLAAAKPALEASSVDVVEVTAKGEATVFLGESGPFIDRQGEIVRLVVDPKGDHATLRLVSAKKMPTNIHEKFQETYAEEVFAFIRAATSRESSRKIYGQRNTPVAR